jgi:hypothetical protein
MQEMPHSVYINTTKGQHTRQRRHTTRVLSFDGVDAHQGQDAMRMLLLLQTTFTNLLDRLVLEFSSSTTKFAQPKPYTYKEQYITPHLLSWQRPLPLLWQRWFLQSSIYKVQITYPTTKLW